ncbi:MAG: endonuclease/exonuclease/phosphatase family protein [Pelagimonas sp.]|uniref:endonuclease/exonuclease/phosphatase family protein n=1 Tax=Pelagimonas sp. TaxID=2073170 RepID=UPI003D6B18A4
MGMRQLEAIAVREIINRKFEAPSEALWCIVGDLNDDKQVIKVKKRLDEEGRQVEDVEGPNESGVDPLLNDGFGDNLVTLLPESNRWTHDYAGEKHKTQLDDIIASPALAETIVGLPEIVSSGMPFRVPNSDDIPRFPRIGWDRPKASDHCPLVVEFRI